MLIPTISILTSFIIIFFMLDNMFKPGGIKQALYDLIWTAAAVALFALINVITFLAYPLRWFWIRLYKKMVKAPTETHCFNDPTYLN